MLLLLYITAPFSLQPLLLAGVMLMCASPAFHFVPSATPMALFTSKNPKYKNFINRLHGVLNIVEK